MAVKTPITPEEQDQAYNPAEIRAKEQFGGKHDNLPSYDRSSDRLDEHPVNAGDTSGTGGDISKNIDDALTREQTAAPINYTGGKSSKQSVKGRGAKLKKFGPLGIMGMFLFGGAGLGFFFLSPGLLLVQMKEVFTNYGSSASRAAPARYNKLMMYTLGNKKVDAACKKSPSGVKCRTGTMSEKQKADYEKAGFKIVGKDIDGRTRVTSIQFPGESDGNGGTKPGKVVKTGTAFVRETKRNVKAGSAAKRAYDPAAKVFNGVRYAKNVLAARWGQDKQKVTLTGSDEERKADIDKRVGAGESREKIQSDFESKHGETLDKAGKIGKVARFTGPVALGCMSYNISRASLATAKVANAAKFVGFAMLFLKVADQIKAEGSVDPGTVATLGTILTSYATSGPTKGLTATDSQGYKVAAYGGESKLQKFTQSFLLGGNSSLIELDNTIKWMQDKFGTKNIRAVCTGAGDPKIAGAVLAAICAGQAGTGAVAGTVVPVAGNVAGFLAGLGACVLQEIAVAVAVGQLANTIVSFAMPHIINALVDAPISSDISGVDAGNAIAAGAGVMLGTTAMSRGLSPGDKNGVTSFLAATSESQSQYDKIARYDAKSEPLNVYNKYSFLGSLVRSSGITYKTPGSLSGGLMNLGTLIRSSVNVVPKTYATASMPVSITKEDLSHCPDVEMTDIGVDCDLMGQPQYIMSPNELTMDVGDNIDYMVENKQVDETTGEPAGDSEYATWVEYCTDHRADLMGSSSLPIEDDDYDWSTGQNCGPKSNVDQTKLSNYRVYYNTVAEKEDADTVQSTSGALSGGSEFRIASFNVLGKSHTEPGPGNDRPGWPRWDERIKATLSVIESNSLDIIAFQEFEPDQRKFLKDNLPNYGQSNHGKESDSIMWNTDKFTLVGKGTHKTVYFGGPIQEPWVKLQDNSTKQEFFVISIHDPINRGQGSAQVRYENALAHKKLVEELQTQAPVFLVGDFNSAYTKDGGAGAASDEKTTYCVLAVNGPMNDAYDMSVPRSEKCPNKPKKGVRNYIDHIYVTPEVEVDSSKEPFKQIKSGPSSNGSDHPTIFSDVIIPGAAGSGAGTEFIMGTYNQPNRGNPQPAYLKIVENKMDVIGMQEIGLDNYAFLKNNLGKDGYDVYPNVKQGESKSTACASGRPIFFNGAKFKFVKGEVFDVPSYAHKAEYKEVRDCGNGGEKTKGGGQFNHPVAWLQDVTTGQTIIVINIHNLASCCGAENAPKKRYQSAQIYMSKVEELNASNPGVPVFLSGDFNEGTGVRTTRNVTYLEDHNNLLYCMFKESKLMFKALGSKDQLCKTDNEGIGQVDFVYATPGVKVEWTKEFIDPSTNDSPHPVHFGKLIVPGSGDDEASTGSDIAGNDYAKECSKYISAADCTGECVGFVKFRLVKHGIPKANTPYRVGGNAVAVLGGLGYKVDKKPAVHSVFSTWATTRPTVGHTGMVSAVLQNGDIIVEEYNYNVGNGYGKRLVTKGEYTRKNYTFAHTEVDYK